MLSIKNFTSSPVKQALRDLKGQKVSAIQEWLEDRWYDVLCSPRRTKYWFLRTFTKMSVRVPSIDGGYHEADYKMLHINFQILVDFMEKEVAHMYDICLKKYEPAKHLNPKTPKEKAIAYYTWEDDMTGRSQAEIDAYKAQKAWEKQVVDLYIWWTETRPNRKDKWEDLIAWEKETGFISWHFEPEQNGCSEMVFHRNHPLWPKHEELSDAAMKREEEWEKEDEEKLIELIKLRRNLWT